MNHIDLKGRTAIVTGGARGIGFAIAQRMLDSGARCVLWDRDPAALKTATAELSAHGEVTGTTVTSPTPGPWTRRQRKPSHVMAASTFW